MILTTTPTVEGRTITEYKGIVFGEVIAGVNFVKDFGASIRNIIGGRSGSYESELVEARAQSLKELEADGMIVRKEYLEVPVRVEYEVTERTRDLIPILGQLAAWAFKENRS